MSASGFGLMAAFLVCAWSGWVLRGIREEHVRVRLVLNVLDAYAQGLKDARELPTPYGWMHVLGACALVIETSKWSYWRGMLDHPSYDQCQEIAPKMGAEQARCAAIKSGLVADEEGRPF